MIRRYWDDTSMQYIEVELQFDGKGPIPGMTGDGWRYKSNGLLDAAPGHLGWPTVAEAARAKVPDGEWNIRKPKVRVGPPQTTTNRTAICACGRKKNPEASICSGCRLGRQQKTERFWPPASIAKMRAMRKAGASWRAIGKVFSTTEWTIRRALAKAAKRKEAA